MKRIRSGRTTIIRAYLALVLMGATLLFGRVLSAALPGADGPDWETYEAWAAPAAAGPLLAQVPREQRMMEEVDRAARDQAEQLLRDSDMRAMEQDNPKLEGDAGEESGEDTEGEALAEGDGEGAEADTAGEQATEAEEDDAAAEETPAEDIELPPEWEMSDAVREELRSRLGRDWAGGGSAVRVHVVPITGMIDLGLAAFVERVFEEVEPEDVIVLDVDTFGGRIDAAVQIRDEILDSENPTIAWVNRRAISAGALISLAADLLLTNDGGSIGAATPIQASGSEEARPVEEKFVSYFRSEMRATAESQDRPGNVAEAMVDHTVVVPGLIDGEDTLTLTSDEMLRWDIAEARALTLNELLELVGLGSAELVHPEVAFAERAARFLTDPTIAGLLMSLGTIGLMVELWQPGFGFPGIAGLTCLGLFFFGHLSANLAGIEELAMLIVGLILLLVEAFVIPGFGVAGVLGLLLIFASFALALVSLDLGVALRTGTLVGALGRVAASFAVSGIAFGVMIYFLPKSRFGSWLVLDRSLGKDEARNAATDEAKRPQADDLIGKTGVALTVLRPAGAARIDGRRVDVESQGEWIQQGVTVRVVEVEGARTVVVPHTEE